MTVDEWIEDHAYAPDDIVLGNRALEDEQLPEFHQLLDIVRPGWREVFE